MKVSVRCNHYHRQRYRAGVGLQKCFMEKIIVVINSHKPNIASIDFACRMAHLTGSRLTGLFVENIYFEYKPAGSITSVEADAPVEKKETILAAGTVAAIQQFTDICHSKSLQPDVYV